MLLYGVRTYVIDTMGRLRRTFHRLKADERGTNLTLFALSLPVLLGFAGLGTESGLWYLAHQSLQNAADTAALSAAAANISGGSPLVQAKAVTADLGIVHGTAGAVVTVNLPPTSGTHIATTGAVEVVITQDRARLFTAMWNSDKVTVRARAVAVAGVAKGCALALDPSAAAAASVQGSTTIALNGCDLYVNSSSATALDMGGSATLSARFVGVVGGISGAASITTTAGIATHYGRVADPYAASNFPAVGPCNFNNYTAKAVVTINPGVYCGGIQLNAGAVVTMNPGLYYLDRGDLKVNGGATLKGSGVTIIFTSSTGTTYASAAINGGATIALSAPTSGSTAGIVLFGDRNMPANTAFNINGGSGQSFGGAIYLPKADLNYSGGASASTQCTQVIANLIDFSGGSSLAVNCSGYGTKDVGSGRPALVE